MQAATPYAAQMWARNARGERLKWKPAHPGVGSGISFGFFKLRGNTVARFLCAAAAAGTPVERRAQVASGARLRAIVPFDTPGFATLGWSPKGEERKKSDAESGESHQ